MAKWGKFTVRGSGAVEDRITAMVQKIADAFQPALLNIKYRALVMLGGYGRGEGGVVIQDGLEKPHNNFDLVLFTEDLSDAENGALKDRLVELALPVMKEIEMAVDLSVLSADKVKRSDCRIIWYDMRYGHKTLLGDPDFVPSLTRFTVANIPDWDARNLLVNRGTLMVINDVLLDQAAATGAMSEKHQRLFIKHTVKGIIGYGDALLYFLGDYDWSYVEKQNRMRKRSDVDAEFKAIYEEAMNFRFQPDYETFLKKDLAQWSETLRAHFERIALLCETLRLRHDGLDWPGYTDAAFRHALFEDFGRPRAMAKKVLNMLRGPAHPGGGSMLGKLGFRGLGAAGVMPILFPVVAYHLEDPAYRELAADFLGAAGLGNGDLRRAYLGTWGETGDTNFSHMLDQQGISLQPPGTTPKSGEST